MILALQFKELRKWLAFAVCLISITPVGAEIHGSATAMSENVGKGYSKSNGDFSGLVNLDFQHAAGFYAGVNAAYVNFGDETGSDKAHAEITPYLGWTFSLPYEWRIDVQESRYLYDGKIFGQSSDYNEFSVFLHWRDMLSANVAFAEDYYRRGHTALNYQLTGRYPFAGFIELSGGIGYTQAKQTLEYDYLYWNAGISGFYNFATVDLRYVQGAATASNTAPAFVGGNDYYPHPLAATLVFSISIGF